MRPIYGPTQPEGRTKGPLFVSTRARFKAKHLHILLPPFLNPYTPLQSEDNWLWGPCKRVLLGECDNKRLVRVGLNQKSIIFRYLLSTRTMVNRDNHRWYRSSIKHLSKSLAHIFEAVITYLVASKFVHFVTGTRHLVAEWPPTRSDTQGPSLWWTNSGILI